MYVIYDIYDIYDIYISLFNDMMIWYVAVDLKGCSNMPNRAV